jgi:hypothetical protein
MVQWLSALTAAIGCEVDIAVAENSVVTRRAYRLIEIFERYLADASAAWGWLM